MMRRIVGILLGLSLVLGLTVAMSATAYATDEVEYELWVSNKQVTSVNASDVFGDGTVSFIPASDGKTGTLILSNANITKGYTGSYGYQGIYYAESEILNVVLEGNNRIEAAQGDPKIQSGIFSPNGDIIISGDGSLNAAVEINAVYAFDGNVTIESGAITANYLDTGIWANGNVSIEGGTMTVSQCLNGINCKNLSVSDGTLNVSQCYAAILASGNITISGGKVTVASSADDYYSINAKGSINISGGEVEATGYKGGITADDFNLQTFTDTITISGGKVTASATGSDGNAIHSSKHTEITGGTVIATATEAAVAILAANGEVVIEGGSITASAKEKGIDAPGGFDVIIGRSVVVRAGSSESDAKDVTETYARDHDNYAWVQTETATLWVGGIPVTSRNASDILGDLDDGASAKYDANTKTLTLNDYNYVSEGYRFGAEDNNYAAIYTDQDLMIQFAGDNTVKCTEKENAYGFGIHSNQKALIISGNGTLTATGYGLGGVGILTSYNNITINGGTVNASGDDGLSANGGSIIINDGIVTASGGSMGCSADNVEVADEMGINAGDSKETAIGVDKEAFKTIHPQPWVQISKAYPLWVRGIRVMVANKDDVLGDNKVSYDPDDNTLTLKGADIKADSEHHHNSAAIYYGDDKKDLIIDATKDSTVKGPDYDDPQVKSSYGILSTGSMIVKGKLTAVGKDRAIDGIVKNAMPGLGWTNMEGTKGKTEIKVNTRGQKLSDSIKKAVFPAPAAAVTKAPAAKNLTYNGSAQGLVTAGKASYGVMNYAIGKSNKTAPTNGWSTSIPKGTNAGSYYVWYKAAGDAQHKDSEPVCVIATIKASVSGTPMARMTAKGSTGMTISWNKIQGAAGYDIFFAQCDHNGRNDACKKVKNIKGNKTFKWTRSGLKKGTAYKAYVKAYVMKNGKKNYVRITPIMHAYTGNGTRNYTNAKRVTVNRANVTLNKGKVFTIKAKVVKVRKNRKLISKLHAPTLRYVTSNSKVATVNANGKITARGKGTCYIYAFAHNGISKQVKVTVK